MMAHTFSAFCSVATFSFFLGVSESTYAWNGEWPDDEPVGALFPKTGKLLPPVVGEATSSEALKDISFGPLGVGHGEVGGFKSS